MFFYVFFICTYICIYITCHIGIRHDTAMQSTTQPPRYEKAENIENSSGYHFTPYTVKSSKKNPAKGQFQNVKTSCIFPSDQNAGDDESTFNITGRKKKTMKKRELFDC